MLLNIWLLGSLFFMCVYNYEYICMDRFLLSIISDFSLAVLLFIRIVGVLSLSLFRRGYADNGNVVSDENWSYLQWNV